MSKNLKIEYLYEHNANVDYIFIRRKIHYKNQLLDGQYQDIYNGEPSHQKGSIGGLNEDESAAIIKDLKQISPIIEALFQVK